MSASSMDRVDHVYPIYVKASAERIWQAITSESDTIRYDHGTRVMSAWTAGAALTYRNPDGSIAADGEVLEIEPGRMVVMSLVPAWSPGYAEEGPIRQTWLIEAMDDGTSRLSVTSALVHGSWTEAEFSGGVVRMICALKTLLETGAPMGDRS